jgi:hypothetical protein
MRTAKPKAVKSAGGVYTPDFLNPKKRTTKVVKVKAPKIIKPKKPLKPHKMPAPKVSKIIGMKGLSPRWGQTPKGIGR